MSDTFTLDCKGCGISIDSTPQYDNSLCDDCRCTHCNEYKFENVGQHIEEIAKYLQEQIEELQNLLKK